MQKQSLTHIGLTSLILMSLLAGCLPNPESVPQPAVAMVQDLTIVIEASGTLRAAQTAVVLWQTSGEVGEVFTSLGEAVTEGQVLAELRLTSLPQTIILASANVNSAVAARDAIDDLYGPVAIAQAAQAVAAAEEALAKAKNSYTNTAHAATEAELSVAQANLTMAQRQYNALVDDNAKTIRSLDKRFLRIFLTDTLLANLSASEATALEAFQDAQKRYENLLAGPDADDVAIAAANVQLAEAQLADAQLQSALTLAGPPADDLAAADARIVAAQSIEDLRRVSAPFSGTLTQGNWLPGDRAQPGDVAFRIDDLSGLHIDVRVAETDVNRVEIGQLVEIEFDSVPGVVYSGAVEGLDPVGDTENGIVSFTAQVRVIDADERLRPGMSADIRIVLEVIENALTVPSAAIRVLNDERVVYVLDAKGKATPVAVELGRTVGENVQITGGDLKAGDVVSLETP
jgi:HlyD family secretion protein